MDPQVQAVRTLIEDFVVEVTTAAPKGLDFKGCVEGYMVCLAIRSKADLEAAEAAQKLNGVEEVDDDEGDG